MRVCYSRQRQSSSPLTMALGWETEDHLAQRAFPSKPAQSGLESLATESECLGI